MITPYVRPQAKIFQNLRDTASNAVNRFGALTIGTQYLLSLNDGRAIPELPFSADGDALAYKFIENGVTKQVSGVAHTVKQDSVRLYGKGLEAVVATGITTLSLDGSADRLRDTANFAALGGRTIRVGDVLVISADNDGVGGYTDGSIRRKVTELLPKVAAPTVAATVPSVGNAAAVVTSVFDIVSSGGTAYTSNGVLGLTAVGHQKILEIGSRYNGKVGEKVTLVCTTGGGGGVAKFTTTYAGLGVTTPDVAVGGVGNDLVFTLAELGATAVPISHTAPSVIGDTIVLTLYPAIVAPNLTAAMFAVEVPTVALYSATVGTSYVIEVVKGGDNTSSNFAVGTRLRIYDTAGLGPVQTVDLTGTTYNIALGVHNLKLNINTNATASPDLVTGDKFIIGVTSATVDPSIIAGVKLDGPAVNTVAYNTNGKISVDVRETFTGELTPENTNAGLAVVAGANSAVYPAGLRVLIAKTVPTYSPFITGFGKLIVTFKAALKPTILEGPQKVTSRAAVTAGQFGELHIENDLAYGVYQMFTGAGDSTIHALRTAGESSADFAAAVRKIRGVDVHYALVPLTEDLATIKLLAEHCEEMSNPDNMNFRRLYFGTSSPGEYVMWGADHNGAYRKATLNGDTVIVSPDDAPVSNFLTAYTGDKLSFLSLVEPLVITEILSATSVRVANPPVGGLQTPSAFKLLKPDTAENVIDYVSARSRAVNSRRAVNVWCDSPTVTTNGRTVVVPASFIAAEVGGLRSALKPQQGLTMTEIASVTAAPAMFARFTPEQLDRAAANGVMVITQEIEGGEIFIRHQLTTRTGDGALQHEDNPGVVVDAFSYRIKDKFRNFIGKKNATDATIAEIRTELRQVAIDSSQEVITGDASVGPLIESFANAKGVEGEVTVELDGDLADRVRTFVLLRVAQPLNGLSHYVDAEAVVTI